MSNGKVFLGVVAGTALGATLGLLFAPKSGRETRQEISDKTNEYADEIKRNVNEYVDTIKERFESAKEESEELSKKAKNKAKAATS